MFEKNYIDKNVDEIFSKPKFFMRAYDRHKHRKKTSKLLLD